MDNDDELWVLMFQRLTNIIMRTNETDLVQPTVMMILGPR